VTGDTRGHVAAIVLLREDGAALLQHRDDKPGLPHAGMWTPPGGHCEPHEAIETCARREFREETAYELGDLYLLDDFIDDHVAGFPPLHLTVFWSRYDGRQPVECREGQGLEFIERSRASRMAVPGYLVALWDRALQSAGIDVEAAER